MTGDLPIAAVRVHSKAGRPGYLWLDYDASLGAGRDYLIGLDTGPKRQLAVDQRSFERAAVEQRGEPIGDCGRLD
jgi:hypothetical protein